MINSQIGGLLSFYHGNLVTEKVNGVVKMPVKGLRHVGCAGIIQVLGAFLDMYTAHPEHVFSVCFTAVCDTCPPVRCKYLDWQPFQEGG